MVPQSIQVILVMGVSGSGKSTIGESLAQALGWHFYDADDFHPEANIKKMSAGVPLTDEDRWPWLDAIHQLFIKEMAAERPLVLAGSALKESYRRRLLRGIDKNAAIIFLKGSYDLIWQRMESRTGHYMQPNMLKSQFDTLEEPRSENLITIDIDHTPAEVVELILNGFKTWPK
ncbi:MAG: gluconokinase [Chloroflexota bacterium]